MDKHVGEVKAENMPDTKTETMTESTTGGRPFDITTVVADTLIAEDALQREPVKAMRYLLWAMAGFVSILILWACFSVVDVVVTATGKLVPTGQVKVVQAPEAGVLRAINVRDGELVRAGQALIELDSTSSDADEDQLVRQHAMASLKVARVSAFLEGQSGFIIPPGIEDDLAVTQQQLLASALQEATQAELRLQSEVRNSQAELTAARASVSNLERVLPNIKSKLERHQSLHDEGYLSMEKLEEVEMEFEQTGTDLEVKRQQLEQASAGLTSARSQLDFGFAEQRNQALDELAEATRERDNLYQELLKARQRAGLQVLRAPLDGIVQQLDVHTVGGVVIAAQQLLVIVPREAELEVEAQVFNKDIGFVHVGQAVDVKVDTYDFTRYGSIDGELEWVATNSVLEEGVGPVFPVRVAMFDDTTPNKANGSNGELFAGMSVTTDIVIGQRRMIEYFLGPIMRYKDESLRER